MTANEEITLQELLDEGYTIDEAKSIIQASHDEHFTIKQQVSEENIEQKMQEKSNHRPDTRRSSESMNQLNHLCKEDIELLLRILKKIHNHPNEDKYKDINHIKLSNKIYNYYMCINILKEAGFKTSNDESRLLFDNKQYDELDCVYGNLLSMQVYNSNQYISHSSESITQWNLKHLLKSDRLYFRDMMTRIGCNLEECQCLHNIANVLLFYKFYIDGTNKVNEEKNDVGDMSVFEGVYNNIDDDYNDTHLLNDFNHLLLNHSHEFEYIYNKMKAKVFDSKDCHLSKCLLMRRNYRDPHNKNIINCIKELYPNENEIVSEQLLDRIHCHFFHTFDIGYKMTEKDRARIIDGDTKIDDIDQCDRIIANISKVIHTKRERYQQFDGLDELNKDRNKCANDHIDSYSYGYRYYYWEWFKKSVAEKMDNDDNYANTTQFLDDYANHNSSVGDFCVENVFNNLKQEALYNDICCINNKQWIVLVNKATIHLNTEMVRNMKCCRISESKYYDMQYGQQMSMDHLNALMLYCNFDIFEFEFAKTYRKLNENEDRESMKERHSMFYWMGRLLRECVECFGMKNPDRNNIKLYHGTNKPFTFCAMNAYIKGPFSTTRDYAVAVNFCENQGMILEMSLCVANWAWPVCSGGQMTSDRMRCFDMQWISQYPNEQEIFCIGGQCPFSFVNIIEAHDMVAMNYKEYVNGLARMLNGMTTGKYHFDGNWKFDSDPNYQSETQMAFRLLAHELWRYKPNHKHAHEFKSCPDYIKEILHINCQRVRFISFVEKETKLHDLYFKYANKWIDLNMINTIFPNVENIQYNACNKTMEFWKKLSMFESVLIFLQNNPNQLQGITVHIDDSLEYEMRNYIRQYVKQFMALNWIVFVVDAKHDDLLMQTLASPDWIDFETYDAHWNKFKDVGIHLPNPSKGVYPKIVTIRITSLQAQLQDHHKMTN